MNTTNFAVFLVIGVLFANVSARVVGDVSKETKLGTSMSKKTATKGIGAELSAMAGTTSDSTGFSYATATQGPRGPSADAYGSGYTGTSGSVNAQGPKASASSSSGSNAQGGAAAAASRRGAAARGDGSASSGSTASGRTSEKKKKGGKGKKN